MKAISLLKLLTLVSFLIVSQVALGQETKEQCKTRIQKDKKSEVESTCNARTVTTTDQSGNRKEQPLTASEKTQCIKTEFETLFSSECGDLESTRDQKASCKTLLDKYDEEAKKVSEECARVGQDSYAKCVSKAKSCSQGLDAFAESPDSGEDSTASALVNLIGVYGQMKGAQAGANGQSVAGCVIENSDTEADKEERIDDKITRLREEITKLRTEDVAEEDQKLNEKRQEVETEMLEARQAQEKAQTEAKTKNQQDAARLAEKIVKVNAQKRQDLDNIAALNEEVSEAQVQIQKVVLSMPDKLVKAQCRGARDRYVKELPPERKKFATRGAQAAFEEEVKAVEQTCLLAQAADKQEKINQINKAKKATQRKIANLKAKIADDAVTVQNSAKEIENLKAIATEQEKKDLDNLTTKLNNLNKTVIDLEAAVERKKKGFEEKAKAKEDQINKLLMDRQNVKSKFAKVYSAASSGGSSARKFVSQCCKSDIVSDKSRTTVQGFDEHCARLRSDYEIKDTRSRSRTGTGR